MPLPSKWFPKRSRHKKSKIDPEYRRYLQSAHWKEIKTKALTAAGGRCQKCGKKHHKLNVHHVHYLTLGKERLEDLLVLCPKCHAKEHGRRKW
jgi:hypothetical protein